MDALEQLFVVRKSPLTKCWLLSNLAVSVEGIVDAMNTLVKEAQDAFKNIAELDAFVNKE